MEEIKVELLDWWNSDRDIAESAWASTKINSNTRSELDVQRVIQNNIVPFHHDTPKECVWFKFFIHCPIFVERQFDKYRMTRQMQDLTVISEDGEFSRLNITQNELSLRYRTMPNDSYELPDDVVTILSSNEILHQYIQKYTDQMNQQKVLYDEFVSDLKKSKTDGIIDMNQLKRAREVFRGILGTSFFTDMQIILNLNSLEHILNQRLKVDAQLEARIVAKLMLSKIIDYNLIPNTIEKMIEVNKWDLNV